MGTYCYVRCICSSERPLLCVNSAHESNLWYACLESFNMRVLKKRNLEQGKWLKIHPKSTLWLFFGEISAQIIDTKLSVLFCWSLVCRTNGSQSERTNWQWEPKIVGCQRKKDKRPKDRSEPTILCLSVMVKSRECRPPHADRDFLGDFSRGRNKGPTELGLFCTQNLFYT